MKSIILNASFAFFIAASATAHAQPGQITKPQVTVSYADLDLSREAGARVMLDRLESAASHVCGGWPDMHILNQIVRYHACTRQAMDDAIARLDSPKVSALYGVPAERVAMSR